MSDFEQRYKTWHTYMSITKSLIRMVTSIAIVTAYFFDQLDLQKAILILAAGYGIAEFVGVLEEL